MASYKEANERLLNTGSGIKGLAYTNFQELIVNTVCKYYFELDPVLKDRPNVYAWHTNDKARNKNITMDNKRNTHDHDVQSILLSSDDEDISDSDNNITTNGVIEIDDDDNEYYKISTFQSNKSLTNTPTNTKTNRISSDT